MSPAKPDWSPNPRQLSLLEEVRTRGAVSVERLASRLNVTMQTVRRDVQRLAEAGLLQRFHGGVSLPPTPPSASAWKERQAVKAEAKARIARSVVAAIPAGSTLMLGNGTTLVAVAQELLKKTGLTVITHNLLAASVLAEHPDCKLHVAGGLLRHRDSALEGDSTVAFMKQFKVDIAIISAMGIEADGSLRDLDRRETPVAQALIGQARETWLAVDVSKFNQTALASAATLSQVKRVFTEGLPPAPFPLMLHEADIALTIAP
ncbi:DeoR/GlpR family DNA-binding transcription regulator [Aquabacterium sp.]|uniref:DeoR/GlpR family DNA-binding transcription regulator n=1 Tax=Aquabacterium sp. TaxID=1872578 RepID=UPI0035AE6CE5